MSNKKHSRAQLHGRTITQNNEEWLYFSGTAYLGIPFNKEFQEYLKEGFSLFGTNYGGSRLSNLPVTVFQEAEDLFCSFTGASAALTVSSGTLAGQLVVRCFQNKKTLLYAPGTHPALFANGQALQYINRLEELEEAIQKTDGDVVLLANSIDPLRLKVFDWKWIKALPKNKKTTLVLDDSHGISIIGKNGGGIFHDRQLPDHIELIIIASLGKAMGIPGGIILGSKKRIQSVFSMPFFGGASPIIPAYLYAFLKSKTIYKQSRSTLQGNIQYFRQLAQKEQTHFDAIANYPVFATKSHELAAFLKKHKVVISSFSYPTSQDEKFTRIVLNSLHTKEDIEYLVPLINRYYLHE